MVRKASKRGSLPETWELQLTPFEARCYNPAALRHAVRRSTVETRIPLQSLHVDLVEVTTRLGSRLP